MINRDREAEEKEVEGGFDRQLKEVNEEEDREEEEGEKKREEVVSTFESSEPLFLGTEEPVIQKKQS